ncbi:MAG: hypothetical protein KJ732_06415 [Candidatus Margulisbacteria bacterium]|nr:hypothetical protein [Candidatus Margulisiibacteriota bacterium]
MGRRSAIAISAFALATGLGGYYAANKVRNQRLQITKGPSIAEKTQSAKPACYYRDRAQGLPYDYYLWQGERSSSKLSSAPALPPIFTTREEILAFEGQAVRPQLKRLPSNEEELRVFLKRAEQDKQITWISNGDSAIYDMIQGEVNSASPGQNVHLVFGFAHGAYGHSAFLSELLIKGGDGHRIDGATHLALEYGRIDSKGADMQTEFDRFLITGDVNLVPVLTSRNWPGTHIPMVEKEEIEASYQLIKTGFSECYNLVVADLPPKILVRIKREIGDYNWFGAREIFAVSSVWQRQDPGRRDVVFWKWGASHSEKHRLPFYISIQDPKAKVVSLAMNGGTYVDAMAFDRVLKKLGWLEKTFILKLFGYRDADYIIHIPSEGRERWWGISRERDPVVQHIFDPPE